MQATFEARRSQASVFLIALALLGALILGGAGGYMIKSQQGSAVAPVRSGSGTVVQSSPVLPDWAYRRQPPPTPQQTLDPSGHVIRF